MRDLKEVLHGFFILKIIILKGENQDEQFTGRGIS